MSDVVCGCPRDSLCRDCIARQLSWHRGTAYSRGDRWASSVAERQPELLARPWPALDGRCAEITARWVVDLSDDVRVLKDLLGEVDRAARSRWERLRAERVR